MNILISYAKDESKKNMVDIKNTFLEDKKEVFIPCHSANT